MPKITVPHVDTIRCSAIAHLRALGAHDTADLLSRCKLELGENAQAYSGSTEVGLTFTLRCKAIDLQKFVENETGWELASNDHAKIKDAIQDVLPAQLRVHDLKARSLLVDREQFEKSELELLIEAQKGLMIAVATGGPRIESKNSEYRNRRQTIAEKLSQIGKTDPNSFEDLWAWYGRWSSGDLPTYKSRREYIAKLYQPLLEELAGASPQNPAEPNAEPTGWDKVDRVVEKIIAKLASAENKEEDFQVVGLLCRECLISLAQAVYVPDRHPTTDGTRPSETDAFRMLDAYFTAEFGGASNEELRRHAKASLNLANYLQHKRTAQYKDAALCSEATRTVVNIVAISSGRR